VVDLTVMRSAFKTAITELGVPAVHVATDPAGTRTSIPRVGFATVRKDNETIINALGIDAKVITVDISDIVSVDKFDVFEIGTEHYVAHTVHKIHMGTDVIGFKVFAKGS